MTEGKECWALVVGAGPSLRKEDVDLLMQHVQFTVAVNSAVNFARAADELYFSDRRWHDKYVQQRGDKVFILDRDAEEYFPFDGHMVSLNSNLPNVERYRPRNWLRNGGNSGHQGMQRAVDSGYRNVVLLGFDHMHQGDKAHFHADHPAPMPNAKGVIRWRKEMDKTAVDLKRMGVRVYNCSRESALECFVRVELQELIGSIV